MSPFSAGRAPRQRRDPYLELADDAAHERAVRARAESRARQERAGDVATWVGTLRDLAERAATVLVGSASGRTYRGVLGAVAADHVVVRPSGGGQVVIRRDAIRLVRPDPGIAAPAATGDRPADHDGSLVRVLEARLEDREPVTVVVAGRDERVEGEVIGLGEDVVTLRLTGEPRTTVYVPVAAILELVLPV